MRVYIILVSLLLLCSCSLGTVKGSLNDPAFKSSLQPTRTLRILCLHDNSWSKNEIEVLVKETSDVLEPQTGIRLEIISMEDFDESP